MLYIIEHIFLFLSHAFWLRPNQIEKIERGAKPKIYTATQRRKCRLVVMIFSKSLGIFLSFSRRLSRSQAAYANVLVLYTIF